MLKSAGFAVLALAAGVVVAQGTVAKIKPKTQAYALDAKSNGKEMTIKVGEKIVVTLETNPTTGYQLFMLSTGDEPWTLSSKKYIQDPHEDDEVGVGGRNQYVFTATKKGQGALSFVSARGFDLQNTLKGAKPWQVTVTVE